jgi:catechol 2,3-dioxygenase-like lactoylglutathione lyase family enzyme
VPPGDQGRPDLGWPNWVGVVAEDLEAQRTFYRDVLGLRELAAGRDWVQFDLGWPNLFELIRRSEEPQYDSVRYQAGFAVDDIHETRRQLIALGVEALTDIDGGPDAGGYWCYFRDPEGNVFEISQRVGETWP